jgi:hypothetical protein
LHDDVERRTVEELHDDGFWVVDFR